MEGQAPSTTTMQLVVAVCILFTLPNGVNICVANGLMRELYRVRYSMPSAARQVMGPPEGPSDREPPAGVVLHMTPHHRDAGEEAEADVPRNRMWEVDGGSGSGEEPEPPDPDPPVPEPRTPPPEPSAPPPWNKTKTTTSPPEAEVAIAARVLTPREEEARRAAAVTTTTTTPVPFSPPGRARMIPASSFSGVDYYLEDDPIPTPKPTPKPTTPPPTTPPPSPSPQGPAVILPRSDAERERDRENRRWLAERRREMEKEVEEEDRLFVEDASKQPAGRERKYRKWLREEKLRREEREQRAREELERHHHHLTLIVVPNVVLVLLSVVLGLLALFIRRRRSAAAASTPAGEGEAIEMEALHGGGGAQSSQERPIVRAQGQVRFRRGAEGEDGDACLIDLGRKEE